MAAEHPMLLSYARPLEAYDLDFYSDDLEDYSDAGATAILDQLAEIRQGLGAYDRNSLSLDQQLSYDVLEWLLETQEASRAFLYHVYPVNQFNGSQSGLPDFMVNIHQIDDERDAHNYLARIANFELALAQMRQSVLVRAERGFLPPRFVLRAVASESASFADSPVEDNVLYTKLAESLDEIADLSATKCEALLSELPLLIREIVQPGYQRLAETLTDLATEASEDDGVWKHPDGEAYYRWALRWHTTTNKTADEVHRIRLAEMERIHGEMSRILASWRAMSPSAGRRWPINCSTMKVKSRAAFNS